MDKQAIIESIGCCPICRSSLSWGADGASCPVCPSTYIRQSGKLYFTEVSDTPSAEVALNFSMLEEKKPIPKIINRLRRLITSQYRARDHMAEALEHAAGDRVVVDCGSGNRRLSENCINIDLIPFDNVDIICDIMTLPFEDGSVDTIILDTVLEHVENPQRCVDEANRVLKPGGKALCITPFIFPYHAYPRHFWNFSEDGLHFLFRHFSDCSVRVDMGPTSALINLWSEYIALLFKGESNTRYLIGKGMALLPLGFFRFVDYFWKDSENAKRMAMCLFAVSTK